MASYDLLGIGSSKGKKSKRIMDEIYGTNSKKIKFERIPVPQSVKNQVLFNQKGKCAHSSCNVHFHRDGITPHFDHITRVEKGGISASSNIQALCPTHHQQKTHKENFEKAEKKLKKPKKKENSMTNIWGGKPPKKGFF